MSVLWAIGCVEEGLDVVRELLFDPRRFGMGGAAEDMPFWIEGFEVVREDGKDDKEGRRLEAEIEPLVDGRYGRTEAISH